MIKDKNNKKQKKLLTKKRKGFFDQISATGFEKN